jgi:hypothetical protein
LPDGFREHFPAKNYRALRLPVRFAIGDPSITLRKSAIELLDSSIGLP